MYSGLKYKQLDPLKMFEPTQERMNERKKVEPTCNSRSNSSNIIVTNQKVKVDRVAKTSQGGPRDTGPVKQFQYYVSNLCCIMSNCIHIQTIASMQPTRATNKTTLKGGCSKGLICSSHVILHCSNGFYNFPERRPFRGFGLPAPLHQVLIRRRAIGVKL